MSGSLAGIVLGLLVGLRHAFEPDHLTAVGTLVTEAKDARRGALLGALWGVGHTLALVVVGLVLLAIGATLPAKVGAAFECAVSLMLVILGARAIARASHAERIHRHRHRGPVIVGLVHGLAGSGALTALVFAQLPTTVLRVTYLVLFGIGSIAGMAIASGLAGASLRVVARRERVGRALAIATGVVSIVVGIVWAIPMVSVLLA